jgi:hypothetical protein
MFSIEMYPQRAPKGPASTIEPATVLTKAALKAADLLNVPDKYLAEAIGVSPATMSRIRSGESSINPKKKEGELAMLFVRMFRSLDALFGGNLDHSRAWFCAYNNHLGGVPLELVKNIAGFVHVVEYLDAMRAKN